MAMILDSFVKICLNKLAHLINEEVAITLRAKDDLKKLQETMERITNVLEDAEGKRIEDKAINKWVAKLKDVMYDADDIIDLCRIKGSLLEDQPSTSSTPKVRCDLSPLFSCFSSTSFRREIGKKIKSINERIEHIYKDHKVVSKLHKTPRREPSAVTRQTAPVLEVDIVGRKIEGDVRKIIESLVKSSQQKFCVFAITGMGGIGKTTLAQNIYNDPMINNTYGDQKIRSSFQAQSWVCVTPNFSETELLKEIIRNVGGHYGEAASKAELSLKLMESVSGKNVFLVLDDVWTGEVWNDLLRNPLMSSAAGGRILITTRHEQVAKDMHVVHIHRMEKMDDKDGWLLLQKKVFGNAEDKEAKDLEDTGMEIVKRCDGLPLAIKTIAGVLRMKEKSREEWETTLQSQAWSMDKLPQELRGALYLSYEDLPSHLKQCFLYFSLYPAGWVFNQRVMALYWVAEGFVEARDDLLQEGLAEDYYKELARRNLLQPKLPFYNETECTVHDLLHSLAQFLAQNESFHGDFQGSNSTGSSKLRRLSITDSKGISMVPDAIRNLKCLRTLMISHTQVQTLPKDLFKFLKHLRVLDLSWTNIESLPHSIGNLIHLRLLDMSGTDVRDLPESVGLLRNLQTLDLYGCKSLFTLPRGYSQLCSLRCLDVRETQLSHLPKGIERLKYLNELYGFVAEDGTSEEVKIHGCSIEELQPLSQLRTLYIEKLERVYVRPSALIIKNKTHLYDLALNCTPRIQPPFSDEELSRIEQSYEILHPPLSLRVLGIENYFGRAFPRWMCLSLSTSFPYLTDVLLHGCTCQKLPPLGQLTQLRCLKISGASGVVRIGQEFLGIEVVESQHIAAQRAAFPKLVGFIIECMPNWEEWSCGAEYDGRTGASLHHLPCLERLVIIDCPKLRALPVGLLQATTLKRLHIEGAHSLREIENLSSISEWLQLKNNSMLERISKCPVVPELLIIECPALKHVENLGALQNLYLDDKSVEILPEWFFTLLQQHLPSVNGGLQELRLKCNPKVFKECLDGGLYWNTIQDIPRVSVFVDHGQKLIYTKTPFSYKAYLAEQGRDPGPSSSTGGINDTHGQ